MSMPSRKEMLEHLRIHYGLTLSETMQIVNIPLHPFEMRDEFAKAAVQGILAGWNYEAEGNSVLKTEATAKRAYLIADAMLEARIERED